MSIERKDFNGDYCPENCCFIPKSKQGGNRRNSVMVTINGKTQCLSWWCKEFNINREKVRWLVQSKGITYEEAIKFVTDCQGIIDNLDKQISQILGD